MILNDNSTQQINTLVIQLQNKITNLNNELKSLNKEIDDLDSKISDLEIRDNSQANDTENDIAAMNAKIKANTEAISGKADKNHTHIKSEITDFDHNHDDRYYTESEIDTKLSGKSDIGHTHDDRYYTESEIDTKLSGKADKSHTHNYWERTTQTLDLSSLDEGLYYPCIANFGTTGLARLQVDVHLNSGTKPSWSFHPSGGFSCHFDILTNPSGWGASEVTRIILKNDASWVTLNPVGWSQMNNSSVAVLWLRGGGRYYITKDYFTDFTIQTSAYTVNEESVAPRSDRVLECNMLVADSAYKDGNGNNIAGTYMPKSVIAPQGYVAKTYYIEKIPSLFDMTAEQEQLLGKMFLLALKNCLINIRGSISFKETSGKYTYYVPIVSYLYTDYEGDFTINNDDSFSLSSDFLYRWFTVLCASGGTEFDGNTIYIKDINRLADCFARGNLSQLSNFSAYNLSFTLLEKI